MGQVVVKYKVTMDQPEDATPDYEGIAGLIDNLPEVQNGFALPMNGIGLGVDLNDSILNSQDTSKKITTSSQ